MANKTYERRGYASVVGAAPKVEPTQVTTTTNDTTSEPEEFYGLKKDGTPKKKPGRPATSTRKKVASFKVDEEQIAIIREIAIREHREQADIIASAFKWIIARFEAKHYQNTGEHIKPGDEEQRKKWDNDFMESAESVF